MPIEGDEVFDLFKPGTVVYVECVWCGERLPVVKGSDIERTGKCNKCFWKEKEKK